MKKIIYIVLLFACFTAQAQVKIGGISMPSTFKAGESNLVLNGAGVREKYWIDLYVGGLFLKAKDNDATKIINADENMAIRLHIISSLITSEKMTESVDEGFKNSLNGNTAPLANKILLFKTYFKEKISDGDIFDLVYEANKGVTVYKNNKALGTITGLDFKKALFGIWLCEKAASSDLKKKLLGN